VTLERELGYTFKKTELLIQALTRRSYANEHPGEKTKTSEPLSFLGDAVLDLAVSEHLVSENPELTEGQLTNRFQGLASELQCAAAGTKLRLYNYLRLGGGEKPLAQTANFMAEAYEALIGALFLDGLYGSASAAVKKTLLQPLMSNRKEKRD
jgi:dsRNA-specific ribonuclease